MVSINHVSLRLVHVITEINILHLKASWWKLTSCWCGKRIDLPACVSIRCLQDVDCGCMRHNFHHDSRPQWQRVSQWFHAFQFSLGTRSEQEWQIVKSAMVTILLALFQLLVRMTLPLPPPPIHSVFVFLLEHRIVDIEWLTLIFAPPLFVIFGYQPTEHEHRFPTIQKVFQWDTMRQPPNVGFCR